MKHILKPFAVLTLTSCLTTLQFSSLAWGQEGSELRTSPHLVRVADRLNDLATPSLLTAPIKGFAVDLGYTRYQEEVQLKNVVGKADTTADLVNTSIFGAITPNLFGGVSYGYKNTSYKADFAIAGMGSVEETNSEGAGDPTVTVGGRLNFKSISVLGTLGYLISTGNQESQMKALQVQQTNGKAGGGQILPKLSVFTNNKSDIIFGGSVSYSILQERKISSKDMSGFVSDYKQTGGNTLGLEAFAETPQSTHSLGVSLGYKKDDPTKQQSITTFDVPGSEQLSATLYGNIHVTDNISILPGASYFYYMNDKAKDTSLDAQNMYSGTLDVRLTF